MANNTIYTKNTHMEGILYMVYLVSAIFHCVTSIFNTPEGQGITPEYSTLLST